jgi:hypothetical protein
MLIIFIVLKSREKAKNLDESEGCTNLQNENQRLQSEFTMKRTQYDQLNK